MAVYSPFVMDFQLQEWIKGQGWSDGYTGRERKRMADDEQQGLYNSSYQEGLDCELFEREMNECICNRCGQDRFGCQC